MVKHIVFWTLKPTADGATKDHAHELKTRIEALGGQIPGLISIELGIDFSRTSSSADVALYSEFVDRSALAVYQSHPEHLAVAEFVREVCENRVVVDYDV